jgi:hypothetical protein
MEVKDPLPSPSLHIEHEPVSALRDVEPPGHVSSRENHLGDDPSVLVLEVVDAANVSSRHNEEVYGGTRTDIPEYDQGFALVHEIGRPFPPHDLAENAPLLHGTPLNPIASFHLGGGVSRVYGPPPPLAIHNLQRT